MNNREIYVSTDMEADGPIPGPYSMLSLASAAYEPNGFLKSTFTRNLELLSGATQHPDTMKFWADFPRAYESTRENTVYPVHVMHEYTVWLNSLKATPVFVGFPGTWDFMWVTWYMVKFTGSYGPFGYSGLCAKSFASSLLQTPFRKTAKRNFPKRWFDPSLSHTHVALDDAIEQGIMFINMLKENHENRKPLIPDK